MLISTSSYQFNYFTYSLILDYLSNALSFIEFLPLNLSYHMMLIHQNMFFLKLNFISCIEFNYFSPFSFHPFMLFIYIYIYIHIYYILIITFVIFYSLLVYQPSQHFAPSQSNIQSFLATKEECCHSFMFEFSFFIPRIWLCCCQGWSVFSVDRNSYFCVS